MSLIRSTVSYRSADRSRLRLSAACGLLRLARVKKYCDLIDLVQLQRLALTVQVCKLYYMYGTNGEDAEEVGHACMCIAYTYIFLFEISHESQ